MEAIRALHLLGDETLLEEGMTFSMEPGLSPPGGRLRLQPSDNVVVGKETGWVQEAFRT
jgi:Xaa-Pro aminopeptidase